MVDKLTRLGADQLETFRERRAETEIIQRRQRELSDAEARLSLAQAELEASDKDVRDIDAQIREVQGYRL